MTLDPAQVKDFAYFVALVAFQVYNMAKHAANAQRITVNRDLVETGYAALHKDFEEARAAIERMALVINGGDRRSRPLTPADAATAQAAGFGNRWTDPREARPQGT